MNLFTQLIFKIVFYPLPLRILFFKNLLKSMKWIKYSTRLEYDAVTRPSYGFCIYNAAILAKSLGHSKISILEFGVAGGNGLVNIEKHVSEISKELKMEFEIYGFDMGSGLPKPLDYRDMPYMWAEGFYKMDKELLEKKLKYAKLIIGNVSETCKNFFSKNNPAPIGCIMFDLDYYSSTIDSFKIFESQQKNYLPRVYCYFDDIASNALRANNDFVGVLRAIHEFNEVNKIKKIGKIKGLSVSRQIPSSWHDHIFVMSDFKHSQFNDFIGNSHQSIPLQ